MSTASRTPSLTPSRSPSPEPPTQPDHFYGSEGVPLPPSPDSQGKTWLDPADDLLATRGIPVFKPTMEEFADFEGYMTKIECWGMRSGIVKVIPPKEWKDALPPVNEQLAAVKLKNPIEQHMIGRGGLFHQQNIEKRRTMSVREWVELCNKEDWRAPGVDDVGLHHAPRNTTSRPRRGKKKADATPGPDTADFVRVKAETVDDDENNMPSISPITPPHSAVTLVVPSPAAVVEDDAQLKPPDADSNTASALTQMIQDLKEEEEEKTDDEGGSEKVPARKAKGRRQAPTREVKEAQLREREAKDAAFLEDFDPHSEWLPPNTTPFDYTPEFCQKLERQYWRNCGLNKPAWYGADMAGSLFTDETKAWNVAHLPSLLSRILPSSNGLPGVNTPYLYFGMWRATFAWHVEDMDLFSINYIHFGAGKFWYAVPQGRAVALEETMKGHFPDGPIRCPQFLRHKSYLVSPKQLAESSCRPNTLVQHAGEFVITYPRGYHAGFNLGLNCAESVNFALDSWLDLGRKAKACECVSDSVRIDVDELLREREAERLAAAKKPAKPRSSRKRKSEEHKSESKPKRAKTKPSSSGSTSVAGPSTHKVTLKLHGPKPKEPETFPCCLCVSTNEDGLLLVHDPPTTHHAAHADTKVWRAHEHCADVVPETWVDEIEVGAAREDGTRAKQKCVFGVDAIVRDRWSLKCSACTKNRPKLHGAPIQCTKGKCPKAFHVSCAREGGGGVAYEVLRSVEKEVILVDPVTSTAPSTSVDHANEDSMNVDATDVAPQAVATESMVTDASNAVKVIKVIKKVEVSCLCHQHNPAVAEAKKANKQDKIRTQLLALEPLARIKVRISAGVFEVSLVRVIEETKSVEVVWDRGGKREFKWGSVVFGNTEGQIVGQKPTEPAPEPEHPEPRAVAAPAVTYPSLNMSMAASSSNAPAAALAGYPAASARTQYIPYQPQGTAAASYSYYANHWGHSYSHYQQRPAASRYTPGAYGASAAMYGHPTYPQSQYLTYSAYTNSAYASYTYPTATASVPGTVPGAVPGAVPAIAPTPVSTRITWQQPYTGPREPSTSASQQGSRSSSYVPGQAPSSEPTAASTVSPVPSAPSATPAEAGPASVQVVAAEGAPS